MGRINPAAEASYFDQHPADRDVVRPFLSCFDVSHAYRTRRATSDMAVFYLKPEAFIAEMIGLERELLLLYAPYRDFQARTITVHDQILQSERTRLDPLGSIII